MLAVQVGTGGEGGHRQEARQSAPEQSRPDELDVARAGVRRIGHRQAGGGGRESGGHGRAHDPFAAGVEGGRPERAVDRAVIEAR